jgi:hypothetical protein
MIIQMNELHGIGIHDILSAKDWHVVHRCMKHTTFKPKYQCRYGNIPWEFERMIQMYEV